jgi:hypothetical protein
MSRTAGLEALFAPGFSRSKILNSTSGKAPALLTKNAADTSLNV